MATASFKTQHATVAAYEKGVRVPVSSTRDALAACEASYVPYALSDDQLDMVVAGVSAYSALNGTISGIPERRNNPIIW